MTDDLFKSILSEYNQSIEDFGFTEVSEDVF